MQSMRRALIRILTAVFCLSILISTPVFGQGSAGSLVGNVVDPAGASVPGADITITNNATSEKRTTKSNGSGDYQLLSLPPGQYTLTVSSEGFKRFNQTPIEVLVAQTTRLEVKLTIGQVTEQVEVTSSAPIIQAENATLGQVVQGKAVSDMPLNGRNVMALVGLVPGVVMQGGASGNLSGNNVFAAGNFQISGSQANQNSTLVDGAPVNITYAHNTTLVPSQDSVQEFKVQTSSNTAEFGNYTGGVVNMATKSGANAIHGTAFEFLRNTALNATPYFHPLTGVANPPYHQNQFGANVGFPIWKDKIFGFFDYQGYRQTAATLTQYTVPTAAERAGQFGLAIYDPCVSGTGGNTGTACAKPASRTQWANNTIPASRINPVALKTIAFPLWAAPNQVGSGNLVTQHTNNYGVYTKGGGNNDQYTGRIDGTISDKQRVFGRYTKWKSTNVTDQPMKNGLYGPTSPEAFTTNQIALGDTYLFNQNLIGDLRLSYLRYNYARTPGTLGFNAASTLGLPGYYSTIGNTEGTPNIFPSFTIGGNNGATTQVGQQMINSINNNYVIGASVSQTWKNHTFKAGIDLRRLEWQFFQNTQQGGQIQFDSTFTARSTSTNDVNTTGAGFASFLLGYQSAGNFQISPKSYMTMFYQGYYLSDNWLVTKNLTATIGIRWEIPGVSTQRQGRAYSFNPTEVNSAIGGINNPVTGQPILGAFDLVNSPQLPIKGNHYEHFGIFTPRIGLAYRYNDKTVLRAGFGTFVVPSDVSFYDSPFWHGINTASTAVVASSDNNVTPLAYVADPLQGRTPTLPPERDPSYQRLLLGGAPYAPNANQDAGLAYQWNLAIQRQLPLGIALEAAYAGNHGSHLPIQYGGNQVTEAAMAKAAADPGCNNGTGSTTVGSAGNASCFMSQTVSTSVFNGQPTQGNISKATATQSNFYRPFPQYGNLTKPADYNGVSNYHALQMKLEKRFHSGGVLLGSYAFSKFMGNAETLTNWLDAGTAGFQYLNNPSKEYALSSADSRQRLVVSYVYALPIGRGQKFFSNVSGIGDKFVSGWGVNGTTTFQLGNPLNLTMNTNTLTTYAFQGSLRPDVAAGCSKTVGGAMQKKLTKAFNTACFNAPGSTSQVQTNAWLFGNESRTDNKLRAPGQANYDLAVYKDTTITERIKLQLRIESFNLFNRTQFSAPITTVGSSTYGQITSQANQPRLLQAGARINF